MKIDTSSEVKDMSKEVKTACDKEKAMNSTSMPKHPSMMEK